MLILAGLDRVFFISSTDISFPFFGNYKSLGKAKHALCIASLFPWVRAHQNDLILAFATRAPTNAGRHKNYETGHALLLLLLGDVVHHYLPASFTQRCGGDGGVHAR
jgi:hypothetical protein